MHVNLLPQSFVRRIALRCQARRWGLAVALTLLGCGGFVGMQYRAYAVAWRAQSASGFRSKDLHAMKADTQRLRAEIKTTEAAISTLEKAQPDDRTLALLGIASATAQKLDGKIHLKNLTTQIASAILPPTPAPPPGSPGKKPSPAANQTPNDLILEGNAEDAAAISSLVETLRETGVFARVDLTATNEGTGSNAAQRHFRVDCKF